MASEVEERFVDAGIVQGENIFPDGEELPFDVVTQFLLMNKSGVGGGEQQLRERPRVHRWAIVR